MSYEDQSVLIVDDVEENVRLLSDILEVQGLQCRCTTSPMLALKSATANPPDLIITDVNMPQMDGYTLCKELKAHPNTADVPVIFISGSVTSADESKGLEVGATDYITKPFRMKEVMERITAHLKSK